MADQENQGPRFTSEQQRNFASSTYNDAGAVVTDLKGTVWDNQSGDDEPKAVLARKTVGAVAAQISLGMVLAAMGKNNKMIDGLLLDGYVFVGSIIAIGACGFALLLHKHWRSQTLTAGILFGLFSAGIGGLLGGLMANWSYSHFWMVLLLSATIGVDFLWFGLWRNRKDLTIQRSLVVGTLLSLITVVVLVIALEQQVKGEGEVIGATYLGLALGVTFALCFYISFDIVVIALPEAQDTEDWINTAIHVYIDIFKAIWLMILMGVSAITG